jgi:murein DD-endopeptidase MepM/ murein hydrolase activator NlpD
VGRVSEKACYPIDGNPHIYQAFTLGQIPNGHVGVDYKIVPNTPIHVVRFGLVYIMAQNSKTVGRFIGVLHDDGYASWYCHLNKTLVHKGDTVMAGDIIGLSGGAVGSPGAGHTTGPHLHFEVRVPGHLDHNWYNVDPIKYIESYMEE